MQQWFPFSNCFSHLAIVVPFSKHLFHLANIYSIQQTFIPFSKFHYPIAVSCLKAISRTALAYGLAVKNGKIITILLNLSILSHRYSVGHNSATSYYIRMQYHIFEPPNKKESTACSALILFLINSQDSEVFKMVSVAIVARLDPTH